MVVSDDSQTVKENDAMYVVNKATGVQITESAALLTIASRTVITLEADQIKQLSRFTTDFSSTGKVQHLKLTTAPLFKAPLTNSCNNTTRILQRMSMRMMMKLLKLTTINSSTSLVVLTQLKCYSWSITSQLSANPGTNRFPQRSRDQLAFGTIV